MIYLGANAKNQAICFAFCLLLGLAAGLFAMLYLRKAKPLERALTDFFATVCIAAIFIVCVEWIMQGGIRFYGTCAFAIGTFLPPYALKKIKNRPRKNREKSE